MYRIRSTGQVLFESELRQWAKDNNGPSWDRTTDEVLEALGADPVFEGPQASGGTVYQFSQRDGVEQINSKWYTKYVLGPVFTDYRDEEGVLHSIESQEAAYRATKDAEQAKSVRSQRDAELVKSDWMVIKASETGVALNADWAAYRQALRDITAQDGFPWNVTWPTQPE
jgi:hypothetical protein